MSNSSHWGFTTQLLHPSTQEIYDLGSTLPPLYHSNAFEHKSAEELAAIFANTKQGFAYSRVSNPTVSALERRVNQIERGMATCAYGSGMAALSALFFCLLQAGDQVIAAPGLYGGTVELLDVLRGLDIDVCFAEDASPEAFERAISSRTRLLYAETIANPKLEVADIKGLAAVAHAHDIPLAVDNTLTTAALVCPLDLGADFSINSTSKYLNGHSDALGGTISCAAHFKWDFDRFTALKSYRRFGAMAAVAKLRNETSQALGGCMTPETAFLTLIGIETLGLRMERICASAELLAKDLSQKSSELGVEISYPGLSSHPQHKLADEQFGGRAGGILTLRVGSRDRAFSILDSLQIAKIVSNIGDTKTLVVHPATTIAAHLSPEAQRASGVYEDQIRVSVGIEDVADLICDFEHALSETRGVL